MTMVRTGLRAWGVVIGLLVSVLAGRADAALTTSHLHDSSAALAIANANGGAVRVTTEARIGGSNDWELGLRHDPLALNDGTLTTANFDSWVNNLPVPFVMIYDGHRTVAMTLVLSTVVNHSNFTITGDFNEIFLPTRAVGANTSIVVGNLFLNGVPISGSSSAVNTGTDTQDVLRVQGASLSRGFLLTGTITMRWKGARPTGSRLDSQVWLAKVVAGTQDTVPPTVIITAPASGSLLATARPQLTATLADASSGIDPASARLVLDGADLTSQAQVSPAGLSFTPASPLADGAHTAQVSVRDRAGNQAQATVSFTTDTQAPAVVLTSPVAWATLATPMPTITGTLSDMGSGIDPATVTLTVDDVDRSGEARIAGGQISWTPSAPLADGYHVVAVAARDRAGWQTASALSFATDQKGPSLVISAPAGTIVQGNGPLYVDLEFSDDVSGPDPKSLRVLVDHADVSANCAIAAESGSCTLTALAAGSHEVAATIRDHAGNAASAALTFNLILDVAPPRIAIVSPSEGSLLTPTVTVKGTVADEGGVASVTVNGAATDLVNGEFQALVDLDEGANVITVTATDVTGKRGTVTRSVVLDTISPKISVLFPSEGQHTNDGEMRVAGIASDENGIADLLVNGISVPLVDGRFEAHISIPAGSSPISVRARDLAGNQAVANLTVTRFDLPEITITSPRDLSFLSATSIDVAGTVSDPAATVTLNGIPANVTGTSFTAKGVPLIEGGNILTAGVVDANGHSATASISVVRDLTPPRLTISFPRQGEVISAPAVMVSGLVNDIVAGTVNALDAEVTVNGTHAAVANRFFLAQEVPLHPGDNAITVVATDASGNRGEASITVRRQEIAGKRLALASGNLQEGIIGTPLSQPLVVSLTSADGSPAVSQPVLFKVRASNGALDGGKRQIVILTDTAGRASAHFTLGLRAGAGNQTVEALSPGYAGSAVFTFLTQPGGPANLLVDSGDQQVGTAGRLLPRPMVAVVTDRGFNRLEGFPVKFTVTKGQGRFANGLQEVLVSSDSDGRAITSLVLDGEEGIANNVTEARIDGLDPSPVVSFVASGKVAAEASGTSISGLVLDNASLPVPGVTARILDSALTALTDDTGLFHISGAPVGTVRLVVDGSTARRQGPWPDLEFELTTVPGRDNSINMPVYLVPLTLHHGVVVDEARGGTLTLPEVPGFSLDIAPGSVTFPGGSKSGVVSVTLVHGDKVPMVPNFGQQPRFIVTIQPAGARFDPPARLTLPNVEGLAPGEVTEMYSFDHDLGHFVSIGPATVSEDGTLIVSDPGVGVLKAGWHCGGNPASSGTPHACPSCMVCQGGQCAPGCLLGNSGLVAKAAGTCKCDDHDGCTFNDTCDGRGGCRGTLLHVNAVNGDCVAAVGQPASFTADTNNADLTFWNAGDGTPARGQGSSFSTAWSSVGYRSVAAGCRQSATSKRVYVAQSCDSITAEREEEEVQREPPTCADLGEVQPLGTLIYYMGCAASGKWCSRISAYKDRYAIGVHDCHRTDISDANDPDITPANCVRVLVALTPQFNDDSGGSSNDGFWSRSISLRHEEKHVQDTRAFAFVPTFDEFKIYVEDPSRCKECAETIQRAELDAKWSEIWHKWYVETYHPQAEQLAYRVSNSLLRELVSQIKQRIRNAPAAEHWPNFCKE